jgi:hypothetical protein
MQASVQRVETSTHLHEVNRISDEKRVDLYSHQERNVVLQVKLNLFVASYFLWIVKLFLHE